MSHLRQSIGLDVAKDTFVAYFELLNGDLSTQRLGQRKFANAPTGFQEFTTWLTKRAQPEVFLQIIMEATGRYHESLAYHLFERKYRVSIVLPNRLKHFTRSLNQYSKTDPIDARALARYAGLHTPRAWQPANRSMRRLRELSRERQDIVQMRVRASNRLHAQRSGARPERRTIQRLNRQIKLFDGQIVQVEADIRQLQASDEVLARSLDCLQSIPSIGFTSACLILAETNGFNLFENRNQLIKYAGMDIVERQSGTSIRGRGRVSKRGNAQLRSTLYMCALSAIRPAGVFRRTYQRQLDKHGCKKKALMAVQRQLLLVAFGVHRCGSHYDENHHRARLTENEVGEHQGSPTVAHLAS